MPLLTQEKAIKEYYEEVKHKYPDIDFERFEAICKAPMQFIKFCIKAGHLPKILVKHLGKFRVFPSKIKDQLKSEQRFFEKGITDEAYYQQKKTFYEQYLKDLENEREDNDDTEGAETCD